MHVQVERKIKLDYTSKSINKTKETTVKRIPQEIFKQYMLKYNLDIFHYSKD